LRDNEATTFRVGILLGLGGALGQASGLIAAERGLVDDFPALTASYLRILVAAAIMWSVTAWRGRLGSTVDAWKDGRAMRALAAGTVVGPFLGVSLSLVAIQHARVGIAATLMALPPVLLIPIGYLAYGERVSRRGIVGTLIAFGGVALILLPL
jgi:drug/metabolite transporter (DMT)-like permease